MADYKCACRECDCQTVDEFVNGETDENGTCEDCFRDHTVCDNAEEASV